MMMLPCLAQAQYIGTKRLITSLGGGAGLLNVSGAAGDKAFGPDASGSATFRFGYAASQRISFGVHYDRIGTDRTPTSVDRVRFTTYMGEVCYRPWQGERAAVELSIAIGASIISMRTVDLDLPLRGQSATLALGVRYMHRVSGTVGLFVALDHAGSRDMPVTDYDGKPFEQDGRPVSIDWNSQRLNAGLVIRF